METIEEVEEYLGIGLGSITAIRVSSPAGLTLSGPAEFLGVHLNARLDWCVCYRFPNSPVVHMVHPSRVSVGAKDARK